MHVYFLSGNEIKRKSFGRFLIRIYDEDLISDVHVKFVFL